MTDAILKSQSETIAFGKKLSTQLKGGDILCLYGDLGAGKTTLVKGVAQGLEIKKEIKSPTFTLMNIYNIKTLKQKNIKTLVHIDTYRLKKEEELLEIGIEDYLGAPNTVCVIEWPEKIEGLLKGKNLIKINIKHVDEKTREIIINPK
ncbi:MAG: tRNA (adenosine(37)-N6)-threonylcarbamoyltransferase complex ATPase subunit type 1 TsaE [Candidatus Magasanikbacteria bacterium]